MYIVAIIVYIYIYIYIIVTLYYIYSNYINKYIHIIYNLPQHHIIYIYICNIMY